MGLTGNIYANAALGGFLSGYVNTGTINGAVTSALMATAFTGVGQNADVFGGQGSIGHIAAHGVVGCVSGYVGGGGCGHQAFAAAFTKAASPWIEGLSNNPAAQIAAAAATGGTASVIGGGKFRNGAITGSFGYLFNAMSQAARARLIAAGAVAGGTLGAAGAGACTVGTGGVCAFGAPTLIAGGAATGAVVGDALATGIDKLTDKVNGNSWLSPDPTSVYVLNSNVDGSILKFGITNLVGNEMARYSAGEMAALNANMTVIATFDSRAPARMLEIGLCSGYVATTGKLPPASSKC